MYTLKWNKIIFRSSYNLFIFVQISAKNLKEVRLVIKLIIFLFYF